MCCAALAFVLVVIPSFMCLFAPQRTFSSCCIIRETKVLLLGATL